MKTIFHPTIRSHTGMHTPSFVGDALNTHSLYTSITPHSPFLRDIAPAPPVNAHKMVKKTNRVRLRFPTQMFHSISPVRRVR